MGYTTDFYGEFLIHPPVPPGEQAELAAFVELAQDGQAVGWAHGGWCQWQVPDTGESFGWDGGEKFYNYVEWLEFLLEHFFTPKGYTLVGEIVWQGEEYDDKGKIVLDDASNRVKIFRPNDSWTQIK